MKSSGLTAERQWSAKQLRRAQPMAPGRAVKVLLATCPRALLRSTLTAQPSAILRR
ncbi:MAG: hypothetical protein ABSH38_07685 [Verrucomicrobiota bacterium]|jgi:hypothetical protein